MSDTLLEKGIQSAPDEKKPDDAIAQIQVSTEKPDMALLPGGLFVVSIPLNSKVVNRIISLGWMASATLRLQQIFSDTDAARERYAEEEARKGLSLAQRAKAAIDAIVR